MVYKSNDFEKYVDISLTHVLKCVEPYFSQIWQGYKTYEFRRFDRPFKETDTVIIYKYPENDLHIKAYIGYLLPRFNDRFIWYDENERGCIFSVLRQMNLTFPCKHDSGSYITKTWERIL